MEVFGESGSPTDNSPTDNPPTNNNAPEVSFAALGDNNQFDEGEPVSVTVNASDSNGEITSVSLSLDNEFVRTERNAPYGWDTGDAALQNLSPGTYNLTAVAEDNDGLTNTVNAAITIVGETIDDNTPPDDTPPTETPDNPAPPIDPAPPTGDNVVDVYMVTGQSNVKEDWLSLIHI